MNALTFREARHLVSRTGLGAEWSSIKKLEGLVQAQAVEHVINQSPSPLRPTPRFSPWSKLEPMRDDSTQGRKDAWVIAQEEGKRLQGWWIEQMMATQSPFIERMTLFWHGFFTSSIQKTLQPSLLLEQNLMLRTQALGNFKTLLHAVSRDPAMLVYLDGYENIKGRPNENFARELLELFTIGPKEYSQADVKAAAVAFTGWGLDPHTGDFVVRPDQHDKRPVTFLGRTGSFDGADIINILLEHPKTAERLAEQFWKAFVSNSRPSPKTMQAWGAQIRRADYDIKQALRMVLNSPEFWDERNRGAIVKSPIDILIGTARMGNYPRESTGELVNLCRLLGQQLFDPPTVKGWAGGEHWISTQTLLVRASYLAKIARGSMDRKTDGDAGFPVSSSRELIDWLVAVPPVNPPPEIPGNRRLAHALLLDPAFQVA